MIGISTSLNNLPEFKGDFFEKGELVISQVPYFWGRSLDTDPNFGQYQHFGGPFINVRTDKNP